MSNCRGHQRVRLTPIPDLVKITLNKLEIHPEQIRFAVQSDVNAAGTYGEEWFRAKRMQQFFTVTGEGEVLHYIPYTKRPWVSAAEAVVDAGPSWYWKTENRHCGSHPLLKRLRLEVRVRRPIYWRTRLSSEKGKRDEAPIWGTISPEETILPVRAVLLLPDEFLTVSRHAPKKHKVMLPDFVPISRPYRGRGNPLHAICDCWHRPFRLYRLISLVS